MNLYRITYRIVRNGAKRSALVFALTPNRAVEVLNDHLRRAVHLEGSPVVVDDAYERVLVTRLHG